MGLGPSYLALQTAKLMKSRIEYQIQSISREKIAKSRETAKQSSNLAELLNVKKINFNGSSLTWQSLVEYNKNNPDNPIVLLNDRGEQVLAGDQTNPYQEGDTLFGDDKKGSMLQMLLLNGVYTLGDLDGNAISTGTDSRFEEKSLSSDEITKLTAEIQSKMDKISAEENILDLDLSDLEATLSALNSRIESLQGIVKNHTGSGSSFDYGA